MKLTETETKSLKKDTLRHNEYYDMQDIFDNLYQKSLEGKEFKNLFTLISKRENILLAYRNIKRNKGSHTAGTNHRTIEFWEQMPEDDFVNYIQARLQHYEPLKVRRVEIPKPDGRTRPLGIPCIEDRIIQQCIKQILEPICEAKFHPHSYGFRPNRSTEHAIADLYRTINLGKNHYIVDIDIKGFFDNVNHSKLIKQIWTMGIHDKKLISILKAMLRAEIDGIGIPAKGVPQGGILSPLLSNIVLNELDWWISSQWQTFQPKHQYSKSEHKYKALRKTNLKEIYIIRYADDFKILCKDSQTALKIYIATQKWLKERLGLEINKEKSRITNVKKKYTEFLGFKIKVHKKGKKYVVKSHLTTKARRKVEKKIKDQIIKVQKSPKIGEVFKLNNIIAGEHNYYSLATMVNKDFGRINYHLSKCMKKRFKNLVPKRKKGQKKNIGYKTKEYRDKYIQYQGKEWIVKGITIYPIHGITTKTPYNLKRNICDYTEEGRKLIHNDLRYINKDMLNYIMTHPNEHKSIEFNDNRISKYTAQQGICPISHKILDKNMQVHHIEPLYKGGTDEYKNLVIVSYEIHKLIHATNQETIKKYLEQVKLDNKALDKLNKLRKNIGNDVIMIDS